MPTVTIHPAEPADVPLILSFIHELALEEGFTDPIRATLEGLRATLFAPEPAAFARIARLDGEAVGFAVCYFTFSTTLAQRGLHLDDLYVRPTARGSGAGRALLAHLARLAESSGCGRFEWWALRWNTKAIAFYERLGVAAREELLVFRATGEALTKLGEE